MRSMMDELKQQLGSGIALLVNDTEEKVTLMCGVTKDLTKPTKQGSLST